MSIQEKIKNTALWRNGDLFSAQLVAGKIGVTRHAAGSALRLMADRGEAFSTKAGFNETMYRKPERHWIHGMRLA